MGRGICVRKAKTRSGLKVVGKQNLIFNEMKKLITLLLLAVITNQASIAQNKSEKSTVKNDPVSGLIDLQKLGNPKIETFQFVDEIGTVDIVCTTQSLKNKKTNEVTQQVRMEFKRIGLGSKVQPEIIDFTEDKNGMVVNSNISAQRGTGNCDITSIIQSAISAGQDGKPCIDAIKLAINETRGKGVLSICIRIYQLGREPCGSLVKNIKDLITNLIPCLKKS